MRRHSQFLRPTVMTDDQFKELLNAAILTASERNQRSEALMALGPYVPPAYVSSFESWAAVR
jgi:hypothetical protein